MLDYAESATQRNTLVAYWVVLVVDAASIAYVHRRERRVRVWAVWSVLALPPFTALLSGGLLELPLESLILLFVMAVLTDATLYGAYRSGGLS